MTRPRLRLLHETNPEKYFPALLALAKAGKVDLVGAHRYSVVKEWLRAWLRERTPIGQRSAHAIDALLFRFRVPFVRGETIVMGFAPWDWRLLLYRQLARHNRILYQTSWHDWRFDRTPRQPRPTFFARFMQRQWHRFLHHENVQVVAVTPTVAQSVFEQTGIAARVIPHAVPQVFFDQARWRAHHSPHGKPGLKLIHVGEISEKKGVRALLKLMPRLAPYGVTLSVVGQGPLVSEVRAAGRNVTYLGAIQDRQKLAETMAKHDVLVLLSQRTATWEELFGIVLVEALASGLAVIASDHIGPRQILSPVQAAGLFDQDDLSGIEGALQTLAHAPERLAALRNAQSPMAEPYRISSVMAQWEELIDRPEGGGAA